LTARGFSLRVRHIGKRRLQTLKADGDATAGLFVRPE
jgi:triphosphatase